ncbi:MAG: FRG domain-containing protein [Thermodesulfobacteriota bacterium]|jgi:hypothetical protein
MNVSRLEKLTSRHGEYLLDTKENAMVYHVRRPHLLIQACGYLKHMHGKEHLTSVYYRGQCALHGLSLTPSLYRGIGSQATCAKRNRAMNRYIEACRQQGKILRQVPEYAWEPLLQHYGIRSRWIDVVDNVWVALWFACHTVHATGPRGKYLHFERRPTQEDGDDAYAYILLLEVGNDPVEHCPGFAEGKETQSIDLRVACPSTFLRPHAQHGLLVRKKSSAATLVMEYSGVIAGIVRVSLKDAYNWLGDGVLLTTHVLFPPPVYDFGYRDLLNFSPEPDQALGAVHHIGA